MPNLDDYLDKLTEPQMAEYQRLRKIVYEVVPDAEETISYGIPTFKYKGSYVLYFGAFKDHMSIFPGGALVQSVVDRLPGYKIAKGTIQFSAEKPVPEDIIKELIQARLEKIG